MAHVKSPIMYGAHGRVDGVYFRQVAGETLVSAMPRCRRRSLSTAQAAQAGAFRLAIRCLQYIPSYPQLSFVRSGLRSAYNACVSNLVAAMKSAAIPTDSVPGFPTAVAALRSAGSLTASGRPADVTVTSIIASEGNTGFNIINGSDETITAHLWYVEDGTFAKTASDTVDPNDDAAILVRSTTITAMLIVLVLEDGTPVTMAAAYTTYLKTS